MVDPDSPSGPDPIREPARLAALERAALLDTPAEEPFDGLTRLAARLLNAPIALVSLVEAERQFFKSALGLPEPWAALRGTPIGHSFCRYAVESGDAFVVDDARSHPVVGNNPAIDAMGVAAYAGVPLKDPRGHALGTLCVVDSQPRRWTPAEIDTLRELAATVMSTIELRAAALERAAAAMATTQPTGASSEAALPPAVGTRPVERRVEDGLPAAADALAAAAAELLERLNHYDLLLRSDKPTPENLAVEAQELERVRAARAALRRAAPDVDIAVHGRRARRAADSDDVLLTRAQQLRDAAAEHLRMHDRRNEVDEQFRAGSVRLDEFTLACSDAAHSEFVLREALRAYQYSA